MGGALARAKKPNADSLLRGRLTVRANTLPGLGGGGENQWVCGRSFGWRGEERGGGGEDRK